MTSLALIAISSILVSGICMLAMSHAVRQRREADYALAMPLAEAGLNYELRYINTHLTSNPAGHLKSSPYTGSIPGVAGTFTVYVCKQDGNTEWTTADPTMIVSTGTVGGISRTVTMNCKGGGSQTLFGADYAVFGYQNVNFTGALSTIVGGLGSNGSITTSNGGLGSVSGSITLAGVTASLVGGNLVLGVGMNRLPSFVPWPPVDVIAAASFANGWATLKSSSAIAAQSARMRKLTLLGLPLPTVLTTGPVGWTNKTSLSDADFSSLPSKTLILPPGDYYFTDVNITGSSTLLIDNLALSTGGTPGPVRIWIDGASSNSDTIAGVLSITANLNPAWFRVYYNKPGTLYLGGVKTWIGEVYAVRVGSNTSATPATIDVGTGTVINGAVIGDKVVMHSAAVVTRLLTNMVNADDYTIGSSSFGYSDSWKELPISANGATFSDGTKY